VAYAEESDQRNLKGGSFMAEMKAPPPGESSADRRRSHRVNIAMPVLIRGMKGTQAFEEQAQTISVNAHGCMMRVGTPVARAQEVSIVNTKTAEELPCTITFLGQKENGKTEVGVEFAEASPLFWRIAFPPEDWDPSERKRSGSARPSAKPPRR
jgi:PilZ domain